MSRVRILTGDCRDRLRELEENSFDAIVTTPPFFGCRAIGPPEQIGLEETFEQHIGVLVGVFRECRRVLKDDGVFWLHYGDVRAGDVGMAAPSACNASDSKPLRGPRPIKDMNPANLLGLPWRLALALQADGWPLKNAIALETHHGGGTHEFLFELTTRKTPIRPEVSSERGRYVIRTSSELLLEIMSCIDEFKSEADGELSDRFAGEGATFVPTGSSTLRVLDPFGGEGSTIVAADFFGFDSTVIEISEERIDATLRHVERECPEAEIEVNGRVLQRG